jgi:hypothetical protein
MIEYILFILPFTLYFYNTNYLILPFLFYKLYSHLKQNKLTVEDQYQLDINKKNNTNGSIIYVTVEYNNKKYFEDILIRAKDNLINFNNEYNACQVQNKIVDRSDLYIFYDKDDFNQLHEYHYKFYVNLEDMKIISYIKHEYIGGAYLLNLFYCFILTKQKDNNILFPKSNLFNIFFGLKFLLNIKNIPVVSDNNILPLVDCKELIKRYEKNNFYSFEYLKSINIRPKTFIIYNVMKNIHRCLNLNRPLICYLPIAFQHTYNIKNNIGLMWLKYEKSDTYETIDTQLYNNRYQSLGTNSLLLLNKNNKNTGTKARKSVDAVMTFMLGSENVSNLIVKWTFKNVSEYPVYVSISSVMNEKGYNVQTTITSCTERFNSKLDEELSTIELNNFEI